MTERRAPRRPPELSRRSLLRGGLLGGFSLAAAALLGCTQDEDPAPQAARGGGADPTPTPSWRVLPNPAPTPAARPSATPTPVGGDEDDRRILTTGHDLPYPYQFPEPSGLTPRPGGTLSVSVPFGTDTFDPVYSAMGGSLVLQNMVYNRLLGMVGGIHNDPFRIDLEPEIASSWERIPDGTLYLFGIRGDIKWQNVPPLNGRPFTSADVKYAFNRYSADGVHQSHWAHLSSIETPNDTSVAIRMSRGTVDFISLLASRYQTIFPKELVDDGTISHRSVGTGPMILDRAEAGSHVIFRKHPDYFEREVLLDGVEFRTHRDREERTEAFLGGRLDYAHDLVADWYELNALLATNPDVQVNLRPVVNGQPLSLNLSDPRFADERVRQAITLALDPHLMADRVYHNLARVLPLHPWTFVLDAEPYPDSEELGQWFGSHDPGRAIQLLAAAGAEDLSFESIYHSDDDPTRDDITAMAVEQLAAVGITMQSRRLDKAGFDALWLSGNLPEASTSTDDPGGLVANHFFHELVRSDSPKNLWGLDDRLVDFWARHQRGKVDPGARREIHRTMWDYFLDKMFWPPLPSPLGFEVYQPWLRGVRFGGILGTNSSYYDWGDQIAEAWIDDRVPGRQT